MGFLKFLFILFVVVWFVGLVVRATFSRWLRRRTEEYNRAASEAQRQARTRARREGDVTVEATRAETEKRVRGGVGEYVEFEEVTVTEENSEK
jgi:Na+-transporting methylmalonyl-CoA/oxaloacetate decarboxylase gamma subunit